MNEESPSSSPETLPIISSMYLPKPMQFQENSNLARTMSSVINSTPCQIPSQEPLKLPPTSTSTLTGGGTASKHFPSPTSSNNCSPPPIRTPKSSVSDLFPIQPSINNESFSPPITSNASLSPSNSQPLVAALTGATNPNLDHIRLQQLYTLAIADRMRFLHPLLSNPYAIATNPGLPRPIPPPSTSGPPPPPPQAMAHLSQLAVAAIAASGGTPSRLQLPPQPLSHPGPPPPNDFPPHHLAAYYGKFDPRMFQIPNEPKPQHSYIGLISMAILSVSEHKLVLADIYQYILDNYQYFRHRGPGWRNSIRHNLSLNDCFIKAGRAANGKGHYWAIHPACKEDFTRGDYRRRKAQRKVRRHMGLQVDEEDSPSPPPPCLGSPGSILPLGWPTVTPAGVRIPPPILPPPLQHHIASNGPPPAPIPLPASFINQAYHGNLNPSNLQPQPSLSSMSPAAEDSKSREGFDFTSIANQRANNASVKNFIETENENHISKYENIIQRRRDSPIADVNIKQTPSTNSNKRQFDVASLLGHHHPRSKDSAVVAAAAAISTALTNRLSEASEKIRSNHNIGFIEDSQCAKEDQRKEIDDEDDDGNITDNSLEERYSRPNIRIAQDYGEEGTLLDIRNKSYFTPINDRRFNPFGDTSTALSKEETGQDDTKHALESDVPETTDQKKEKKAVLEQQTNDNEDISMDNRGEKQITAQKETERYSDDDQIQNTPTKCTTDDRNINGKGDLDTIRSSLPFMQAASGQSLNNNLFQENHGSPTTSAVSPHEYLARYYQIMQQHQQQAAAAMNMANALPSRQHHKL